MNLRKLESEKKQFHKQASTSSRIFQAVSRNHVYLRRDSFFPPSSSQARSFRFENLEKTIKIRGNEMKLLK